MYDVLVAARTILLPFNALRMETFVLHGEVVPIFAIVAGQNDFFARHCIRG
jgi:hypothetical protein